jgi:hypothetical protein
LVRAVFDATTYSVASYILIFKTFEKVSDKKQKAIDNINVKYYYLLTAMNNENMRETSLGKLRSPTGKV